jgi:hypothetical protein
VIGSVGGTMNFCFECKNKPREKMYMSAHILDTGAESSGVLTNRRGKIVAGREVRAGIWAIRVAYDGNQSM